MAIDTSWANVSLLCPFSVDAQDVKGNVVSALNGAALSSSVGTPFGAGSAMHFDGTNDYATTPAHADFALGSGDFTIEAWVYIAGNSPADGSGNKEACIAANYQSSGGWAFVIAGNGSTTGTGLYLSYWNGSSWTTIVSVTTTVSQGAWHYVMATRVGTATQIWLDAASATTGTNSTNMSLGQLMNFGGISAHTSYQKWLNGYISDLRITKGAGRTVTAAPTAYFPRPTISGHVYDAAAAPVAKTILVRDRSTGLYLGGANSDPSTGLYTFYPPDFGEVIVERIDELADPYWSNLLFASRLNAAGFPTLTGQTLTATGTVTDSAAVADPFGGAQKSALFNGAGSYLVASGSHLLGTTYAVRGWLYTTSLATIQGVFFVGTYGAFANRTLLLIGTGGDLQFYSEGGSGSTTFFAGSAGGTITTNTWHYFEAIRIGATALLFLGGSLVASATESGTESTGTLLHLGYGYSASTHRGLSGRLFEVQITSRVEHTLAYTPPTTPFLGGFSDGGSGENALIYDRVIPGG